MEIPTSSKCDISTLPECEMRYFLRRLIRSVEKYFEDPEVQRRFEEWKRERELNACSSESKEDN